MDIILLKDLDKLGFKHDVINVKNGYARNYLIPQGYAVIANAPNRGKLDSLIEKEREVELAKVGEYQEISKKIDDKTISIPVKAGTSGKIFGSVTNVQVAAAIKESFGIDIDRRKIELPDEIKEMGTYDAKIKLHPEVVSTIHLELKKD